MHVGNRARKRAEVHVKNKNILTFKKIYKACVREIPTIMIRLIKREKPDNLLNKILKKRSVESQLALPSSPRY